MAKDFAGGPLSVRESLRFAASLLLLVGAVVCAPSMETIRSDPAKSAFGRRVGERKFYKLLRSVARMKKRFVDAPMSPEAAAAYIAKHERRGDLHEVATQDEIIRMRNVAQRSL